MIELTTLFSGSSGNAVLADNGKTTILIDSGVSGKRLAASFLPDEENRLCGILVTHDHSDHTAGVGVAARKWNLPVYVTQGTYEKIANTVGKLPMLRIIKPEQEFYLGTMRVKPFRTPHDAAEPVCYRLSDDESDAAVATDMGYMNRALLRNILGCRSVVLESNHDIEMLKTGPYPPPLKERILSEHGHLSNRTAAMSAVLLAEYGTKKILLGHLSAENNTPEKALSCTVDALARKGHRNGEDIWVQVAAREGRSRI